MINWLLHPAVQAGVLPFILALVVGILLLRKFPSFSSIAPMLAFFLAIAMTYGLSDESLLWVRKIVAISVIVFFASSIEMDQGP